MFSPPLVTVKSPREDSVGTVAVKDDTPASLCRRPINHDRSTFRHSLASQYSSTSASGSSQRYSVGSADSLGHDLDNSVMRRWSAESSGSDHVSSQSSSPTGASFSSLPPSSRYLLSGATSSESFREQELSRFYPTSALRHIKALSDPFVTMPSTTVALETSSDQPLDPWCMSVKVALEKSICNNWLHKYEAPAFAFARAWKRRYVVLVDRIVYVFKTSKSTTPAREHFILTEDTLVFVSEEFRKGYVIEIRKPLCKWYLRCETSAQMKYWLEAMKKIVAYIKIGHTAPLSAALLSATRLTDDFRLLTVTGPRSQSTSPRSSSVEPHKTLQKAKYRSAVYHRASVADTLVGVDSNALPQPPQWWKHYQPRRQEPSKRQSLAQIPDWEKSLPPQMPPPRSTPPPPPRPSTSAQSRHQEDQRLTPVSEHS
ncbi:hypothetical protein BJV82DRAFT_662057 [Fennellomyces sp. T-0311]|nr:hypothetical protein BJV82DRAFT_662057 [Fennellomyces sp. T-0311]